jgi:transcriptional regulator with XRE-family HTH domain
LPRQSPPLPAELKSYVDAIGKALTAIGSDPHVATNQGVLSRAVDAAIQAAVGLARKRSGTSWTNPSEVSFTEIVAENLRNLRLEAGWTQQQLADSMAAIGLTWVRETVVEVERTGRKMQLEEVVGVAGLFGVPVLELLLPDEATVLALPEASIGRAQLTELMLGQGGELGEGGRDWVAAVYVLGAGKTIERPAVDLWRHRSDADPAKRRS